MFEASLIVSFYNKINDLELVLAGVERQTHNNFEVIIADDGSNEEAVNHLKETIEKSPLDIKHIWHEDKGFRKTEILNKAVVASNSNYLIFLDGDCIPHSHFVEEHVKNGATGNVLTGRRVNLPKPVSEKIIADQVRNGILEKRYLLKIIRELFRSDERRRQMENGLYIRSNFLRKFINNKKKGLLGSNFSIYKEDLLKVNGFDERYHYPACGEDTDINLRLERAGVKVKTLKHIAIQYHLFHKQLERDEKRLEVYRYNLENNIIYTPFGIEQNDNKENQENS
jgi:glycosyltransferase involved in cell wall biosynthesis